MFDTTIKTLREGLGVVTFGTTVHDPLDEIEIVSVERAEFQEHDISATCEQLADVPAAEFLPYHHGRSDNWLALNSADQADAALERARATSQV
jgi:hypothetical protein